MSAKREGEEYTPHTLDVLTNYMFAEKYFEGGTDDEHKAEFYRWLEGVKRET